MNLTINALARLIAVLAIVVMDTAWATDKPRLVVCYDNYPPSAMIPTPTDPRLGFIVDMVADIYTAQGYQVEFVTIPYARSIKAVEEGDCHITPLVNPSVNNVVLFPKQPSFSYTQVFFVKKTNPWRYVNADSLKRLFPISWGSHYM